MKEQLIKVALAGCANVGKSVIFNHLTGLHQHIGNWPGKTVTKVEGTLHYAGHTVDVIDLPGVYSLSTYSLEELITRNYILFETPDFIVVVVDATSLESGLILPLQILELAKPTVLALNMSDLARKKGIEIDLIQLAELLGVPVVPVTAINGQGITDVLDQGIQLINSPRPPSPLRYGREVEERIEFLVQHFATSALPYPPRLLAIKALEVDEEISQIIEACHPEIMVEIKRLRAELEEIHGHDSAIVIADERSSLASHLVRRTVTINRQPQLTLSEKITAFTGHRILGYPLMLLVLGVMFLTIFWGGNHVSEWLQGGFAWIQQEFYRVIGESWQSHLVWGGIASGLALLEIAISYVLPFYILLFILEDVGYLARVAYLMDRFMHQLGIHGKACIPLILGFGCNVPACLGCKIMETQRERFITGLLATFIPCSAVTVIIAGLVGKFLGMGVALLLYAILLGLIVVVGKVAMLWTPGEPTELIMRMPNYQLPDPRAILLQTWFRLREFIYIAAPIVVATGWLIEVTSFFQWLQPINRWLAPLTVTWLRLPEATGILLIFGVMRKELMLVMLATVLGSSDFGAVLSSVQILTLAAISLLYVPCVATIAAVAQEFGWSKALAIATFKTLLAVGVAGSIPRLVEVGKFSLS